MTQFEHLLKPSFLRDIIKLPQSMQKKVTKAVDFLRQDPRHPSPQRWRKHRSSGAEPIREGIP